MTIQQRYNTKAAALYRDKVSCSFKVISALLLSLVFNVLYCISTNEFTLNFTLCAVYIHVNTKF